VKRQQEFYKKTGHPIIKVAQVLHVLINLPMPAVAHSRPPVNLRRLLLEQETLHLPQVLNRQGAVLRPVLLG
jgi:hypothetical protein